MEIATKTDFLTIKGLAYEKEVFPPTTTEQRTIFKTVIYDVLYEKMIPVDLFSVMEKFSVACYDPEGKGFTGIRKEIRTRIQFALDTGKQALPVDDFFRRPYILPDMEDEENNIQYEIKTGCGNWLYGKISNLDGIRKQYEESGNWIKWDYVYHAKNEKEFSFAIHINTEWKYFFKYLDTYEKGYQSFFKYNHTKSVQCHCTVYEMQTLKTSKKKVAFLRRFTELSD